MPSEQIIYRNDPLGAPDKQFNATVTESITKRVQIESAYSDFFLTMLIV